MTGDAPMTPDAAPDEESSALAAAGPQDQRVRIRDPKTGLHLITPSKNASWAYADSHDLCSKLAATGQPVILSFSNGKDSLGAWLQLREHGIPVIPVYMWLVPGLRFIEQSLQYYEEVFGTHIIRMPHPGFNRMMNYYVFQSPEHLDIIDRNNPIPYEFDDLFNIVRYASRLPSTTLVAMGLRASDNPARYLMFKRIGPINPKRNTVYPTYDWSKDKLLAEIKGAEVKLPIDYRMFKRSFDGLLYEFLLPIREHFPDDYQRILDFFPLAELEIKRIDYRTNGLDHYPNPGDELLLTKGR